VGPTSEVYEPVNRPAGANAGRGPSGVPVFADGGVMGDLVRNFDWKDTSLGSISSWPQGLRTAVQMILNSRYAMFIWWGPELLNLYNDPYRSFLGAKHPAALGRSAREVWSEIWDQIGPRTDAVLLRGESTFDKALLLMMARHGYIEETYFTFSYSPLRTDGKIGGIFCAVAEETEGVIGERRLALLREITAAMAEARTSSAVCQAAAQRLEGARRDLPFSLLYLLDSDGETLTRRGAAGIDAGHPAAVPSISLNKLAPWPIRQVIETGEPVLLENLPQRFSALPHGEWNQPPESAVLLPIARQGQRRPAGVLIAGLNPHRQFDEQFRGFVTVLSTQIAGALANANAYEEERRRAEQLTELDLAKTRFFSNVSHEFRTPLTLMLAPLEDLLAQAANVGPGEQEQIRVVRRNALRLLKLVNTLLDFTRIEAGRVKAVYEPVDWPPSRQSWPACSVR
jgi:GAF domain-containing protein